MIINKSQLILYFNFCIASLALFFLGWNILFPFLMLAAFFPILNKNKFSIVEYLFIISLLLIFFRFVLLTFFDFSFVYIKFFTLDIDIMNYSVFLSISMILVFSYLLFFFEKSIQKKKLKYQEINIKNVNNLLALMLVVKLIVFYFASIKMGTSTSTFQKIIDMIIANLFLIDLLFLITFLYKSVSWLNIILFISISVITTSKSAIFMLILLYIVSTSSSIKYYKIFNLKYLIYGILGILFFIIAGTLSNAARTGGNINFIFLSMDPILGLFRRLGIIDNIIAINTMNYLSVDYFSFPNLILQFILGFIPNSLFDFGYYGVSTGWAVSHYGLGQADYIINGYETSLIGTAILFSHGSILLTFINMILLSAPILIFYYYSKDPIVKYYALFMYIILVLTGDVRVDALFLKHFIIYKFFLIFLIRKKKEKYCENCIHNRT